MELIPVFPILRHESNSILHQLCRPGFPDNNQNPEHSFLQLEPSRGLLHFYGRFWADILLAYTMGSMPDLSETNHELLRSASLSASTWAATISFCSSRLRCADERMSSVTKTCCLRTVLATCETICGLSMSRSTDPVASSIDSIPVNAGKDPEWSVITEGYRRACRAHIPSNTLARTCSGPPSRISRARKLPCSVGPGRSHQPLR